MSTVTRASQGSFAWLQTNVIGPATDRYRKMPLWAQRTVNTVMGAGLVGVAAKYLGSVGEELVSPLDIGANAAGHLNGMDPQAVVLAEDLRATATECVSKGVTEGLSTANNPLSGLPVTNNELFEAIDATKEQTLACQLDKTEDGWQRYGTHRHTEAVDNAMVDIGVKQHHAENETAKVIKEATNHARFGWDEAKLENTQDTPGNRWGWNEEFGQKR